MYRLLCRRTITVTSKAERIKYCVIEKTTKLQKERETSWKQEREIFT
jgi:hypothetical protein